MCRASGKTGLPVHSVGENECHKDTRSKGWEHRLCFLVERLVMSYCKREWISRRGGKLWPFLWSTAKHMYFCHVLVCVLRV